MKKPRLQHPNNWEFSLKTEKASSNTLSSTATRSDQSLFWRNTNSTTPSITSPISACSSTNSKCLPSSSGPASVLYYLRMSKSLQSLGRASEVKRSGKKDMSLVMKKLTRCTESTRRRLRDCMRSTKDWTGTWSWSFIDFSDSWFRIWILKKILICRLIVWLEG